mmetsp:Transcript_75734/g.136602  ORF Transcript_75734/g.136602 Transcript_75734/m.136602 type:complete len:252 (+) Transcript_75734:2525-3280(+)
MGCVLRWHAIPVCGRRRAIGRRSAPRGARLSHWWGVHYRGLRWWVLVLGRSCHWRRTTCRLQDEGIVDRPVIWHLPATQWRRWVLVWVIGPDLIATDLWTEPPAAEVGPVPVIPVVQHHIQAIHLAILLVHWLAVIFTVQGKVSPDDAPNCLVLAARHHEAGGPRSWLAVASGCCVARGWCLASRHSTIAVARVASCGWPSRVRRLWCCSRRLSWVASRWGPVARHGRVPGWRVDSWIACWITVHLAKARM